MQLEAARLQKAPMRSGVQMPAAGEEQRSETVDSGERVRQLSEDLLLAVGATAQQQGPAPRRQATSEQERREDEAMQEGFEQAFWQESKRLWAGVQRLRQQYPAQCWAVMSDETRRDEVLRRGDKRPRQDESGGEEAEGLRKRTMLQQQQRTAMVQASAEGQTAGVQELEQDVSHLRDVASVQQKRPAVVQAAAGVQRLEKEALERERTCQDSARSTEEAGAKEQPALDRAVPAAEGMVATRPLQSQQQCEVRPPWTDQQTPCIYLGTLVIEASSPWMAAGPCAQSTAPTP